MPVLATVTTRAKLLTRSSVAAVPKTADLGIFAILGVDANLIRTRPALTAAFGSFALSGQAANPLISRDLIADAGSYVMAGQALGFVKTTPGIYVLPSSNASYVINGQAANLTRAAVNTLIADAGSYSIVGETMTSVTDYILPADVGSYALSYRTANLTRSYAVTSAFGSYAIGGQAATLAKSGRLLTADFGSYAISGQAAVLAPSAKSIVASGGSYTISGQGATLSYGAGDAAWTTAFIARTSGLSSPQTAAVKTFLNTLATAGLDAKCELMHIMALPGSNGDLNVKSTSYTLTNHGATHSDTVGYIGDGTAYLDTGFSPRFNRVVSSPTDFAWFHVQGSSADYDNGAAICIDNGDFHNFVTQSDFGGGLSGYSLGYGFGGGTTTPYGMITVSHTDISTFTTYENTTQITNTTSASGIDGDFSSGNLCYLGGASVGASVGPIGLAGQFSGLTSGQVTTLFTAAYTLLHALNPTEYP